MLPFSLNNTQSPELRKRNRIRTIQASLAVEGNTFSIDQITAIKHAIWAVRLKAIA